MSLDKLFSQDLIDYLATSSSAEPPLLTQVAQATLTLPHAHMLCGPVVGNLLYLLVKLMKAQHCLEIGTFTGYSALYIAQALTIDGQLTTCEVRSEHALLAQKHFDQSPHGHKIKLLLGPAAQTIDALDKFDFIFIDADKINYPLYYDKLIPKLRPAGLMVVDNALWRAKVLHPLDPNSTAIAQLNKKARLDTRVETVMLSVRDGLLLIYKN